MQRSLAAFLAGLIFGLGLVVSQMIDPAKVLGFLDLAGNWDPSLAMVMLGATRARSAPMLDIEFHGPGHTRVDAPLITGAALFGIGWGLVGYCPGPALSSLALGRWQSFVFVAAMLVAMAGYRFADRAGAAF